MASTPDNGSHRWGRCYLIFLQRKALPRDTPLKNIANANVSKRVAEPTTKRALIMTTGELNAEIWKLDYSERASILIVSLLERHNPAPPLSPLVHILRVVDVMTRYLSQYDRFVFAGHLRDFADAVERKQEQKVIC
jgi:hypothetical protein